MAIFSDPEQFTEHKAYIPLLKKALAKVTAEEGKKFLYYQKYPFGVKKTPIQLVLVDFDANCTSALNKAGRKPNAEGLVKLTANDELNFEASKGTLKRIKLKKYFATMGPGIKPVYVPPGETDDDETAEGNAAAEAAIPVAPPVPGQAATPTAPPSPGAGTQPQATPAAAKQPERTAEQELQRRQLLARIQELTGKTFPPSLEAVKKQELAKATSLVQANQFAQATSVLDQLAAKAVATAPPGPPPQPKTAPAPPVSPPQPEASAAQSPGQPKQTKLSTYLSGRKNLRTARENSEKELKRLQQAILAKAADEPFFKEVEAKSQKLFDYLMPIDESVANKLDDAGRCTDPEEQAGKNLEVRKLIAKQLASVRGHPLASFVEKNPFGKFAIKQPLEVTLSALDNQLS